MILESEVPLVDLSDTAWVLKYNILVDANVLLKYINRNYLIIKHGSVSKQNITLTIQYDVHGFWELSYSDVVVVPTKCQCTQIHTQSRGRARRGSFLCCPREHSVRDLGHVSGERARERERGGERDGMAWHETMFGLFA